MTNSKHKKDVRIKRTRKIIRRRRRKAQTTTMSDGSYLSQKCRSPHDSYLSAHTHTHTHTYTHRRRRNQQWRAWCEESGGWECQKQCERVCKVKDSHKDNTEQCACYIYSRKCLSCTEFFVGLDFHMLVYEPRAAVCLYNNIFNTATSSCTLCRRMALTCLALVEWV